MEILADPITVNCRKVLAGLKLIGADYTLTKVDYFKGEQASPEYMAINPNAALPALRDGDMVLWESNAILQYAADKVGNASAYPTDLKTRADVNRWLLWECGAWFSSCYVFLVENCVKPLLGDQTDQSVLDGEAANWHKLAGIPRCAPGRERLRVWRSPDHRRRGRGGANAPPCLAEAAAREPRQHRAVDVGADRDDALVESDPCGRGIHGVRGGLNAAVRNSHRGRSSTMGSVRAALNYSVDNGRPIDYYFYDPGPDLKLNPPGTDTREMEIRDGWPMADSFSVDREGFEIGRFGGSFTDFDDDAAIEAGFYPQVIDFVKRQTAVKRVEVFDHTIRRRLPDDLGQQTEVKRPAVQLVHCDYTPKSGPRRVRDILPDEAEDLLKGRVVFYNVWKPLFETVEELPLACCDARSQVDEDMLIMELKYRERTGEIFVMRHSENHKWWYFPRMTPDQALLLKTYDSETDGRARFMSHTAFEDPNTPSNALNRQSIEVRSMAFF